MEIDEVMQAISAAPEAIKECQQKILTLQEAMDVVDFELKGHELRLYTEISQDKIDGKPKYSNEKLREAELRGRMTADTNCIKLQDDKYKLLHKMAQAKIDYQCAVDKFKALRYLVQAMNIKWRLV